MRYLQAYFQFLNENKPAGAPDWHESDAPDAEGRFKELSPKDLAAWLIKTRKKDLRKITGSLNQQIVFNRGEDPEYVDKIEKTRQEVYKQLGREDLMDNKQTHINMKYIKPLNEAPAFGGHDKSDYSDEMSYGQLERCMDYAKMIRERIEAGQSLDPWMHSQIAIAENELNAVFDALDGDDGIVEAKEKPGPDPYMTGLDDETEEEKKAQMKKQAEMDDDDPEAYKEMPGSEEARKEGKVKTSKHVKSYHELYGDDEETKESFQLTEGVMSDLHQLAGKVKDEDEFIKQFFKEYGAKVKKTPDSIEWVKSLYQDTVNEETELGYTLRRLADVGGSEADNFLSNNEVSIDKIKRALHTNKFTKYDLRDVIQGKAATSIEKKVMRLISESITEAYSRITATGVSSSELKFLKTLSPDVQRQGPGVYIAVNDDNRKKVLDYLKKIKAEISESLNEEKAEGDRGPIDDEKIETALKKKEEETGVPMQFLRIIMRRGMAAWKTGHRPGATQQQWGYARVNSFLTKQPGTWGGADADVAKEVRDGGHDKKLKKA